MATLKAKLTQLGDSLAKLRKPPDFPEPSADTLTWARHELGMASLPLREQQHSDAPSGQLGDRLAAATAAFEESRVESKRIGESQRYDYTGDPMGKGR